MLIAERRVEFVDIVALDGEMNASTAVAVRAELKSRMAEGKIRFILDISRVPFLDSCGLSVLVTALKTAREMGGDISLLNPSKQAKELIQLTRLHRIFRIFDDEDDAVSEYSL